MIAHAERYRELVKHPDAVRDLVNMGAYIQVNASSILGDDGFGIRRFCRKLMKEDLVHFVGSDAHNMKDRNASDRKVCRIPGKKDGTGIYGKIIGGKSPGNTGRKIGEGDGTESAEL